MADKVRYRVVAPCFVNGSRHEPGTAAAPVFVYADAGLEGKALKAEPDAPPQATPAPPAPLGATKPPPSSKS